MTLTKVLFVVLVLSSVQIAWTTNTTSSDHSEAAGNAVDAAKACYDGFVSNIPPTFCYKKGADFGTIPTTCSAGYFRSLALCYENCDGNFVLGVCWRRCNGGYTDNGATCYKGIFDWYWKSSYIPGSYTNFDSRVGCESGKYKMGALCYRDCSKLGLSNCGIGACAADSTACATTIVSMVADVAISLAQTVTFVTSFGTSSAASGAAGSAAKSTLQKAITQIGKDAVKSAANTVKKIITKRGLSSFIKKMAEDAAKAVGTTVAMGVITTACENVGNAMFNKLGSASDLTVNLQNFDPTGISSIVSDCKAGQVNTEAEKIQCAKSVLSAVSIVDPTGIVGIATAVMQPTCDGV